MLHLNSLAQQMLQMTASFTETLYMSNGNSKLSKDILVFSIPAGLTCPGASLCLSMALEDADGNRYIKDGDLTEFRCYAASQEVSYPSVYDSHHTNWKLLKAALKVSVLQCAKLIYESILDSGTMRTRKVRIHESGDFWSEEYLQAWLIVASAMPHLQFYCYSKNLPLFFKRQLPPNFFMVASYGGKFDTMIEDGHFPVYAKVYNYLEDVPANVPVDWDDSHCFGGFPFALLIHGVQPKGSEAGKASFYNRKNKKQLKSISS